VNAGLYVYSGPARPSAFRSILSGIASVIRDPVLLTIAVWVGVMIAIIAALTLHP